MLLKYSKEWSIISPHVNSLQIFLQGHKIITGITIMSKLLCIISIYFLSRGSFVALYGFCNITFDNAIGIINPQQSHVYIYSMAIILLQLGTYICCGYAYQCTKMAKIIILCCLIMSSLPPNLNLPPCGKIFMFTIHISDMGIYMIV